jgi:hypothetical protein
VTAVAGGSAAETARRAHTGTRVGYEYVHAAIDDHTHLAYAEIHPDEKTTTTCAGFLRRTAEHFADTAMAYDHGRA